MASARRAALLALASSTALASAPAPYGAEPWTAWLGDPIANGSAVVLSARRTARFTVLTPRLLRLEYSPDGGFEDGRSHAFVARRLPVPRFTTATRGNTTTIDTGAVVLTYVDDGAPFSAASLSVQRFAPAFWGNATATWTPALQAPTDAGQLFGTFHTLDDNLDGAPPGGLNCSELDPGSDSGGAADFWPCDFGLASRAGFALVDDSRTPVWDDATGWLTARRGATCGDAAAGAPCFAGARFDTRDADLCAAAGCCLSPAASQLYLWYSASRDDHFSDNLNCTEGCSGLYAFRHAQGLLAPAPGPGLVPLNLYWNAGPTRDGAGGDNVASTFPPTQPGYAFARVEGYVHDPGAPQPPGTLPLRVFYSAARRDHYTTAGPTDEADAVALGYTLVGLAGFVAPPPPPAPPPPAPPPPAPPPPRACYAPAGRTDAYLFAHGADYDGAVADYVSVAGRVPIPRRHWLGVSWSKWNESDTEAGTLQSVESLVGAGFPLDTYVFDMQWHRKPAWGGYDWDPSRYADPAALLSSLHARGLATGANFHDADGVTRAANPSAFAAFAAAVGAPPAADGVAFAIGNRTYADALQRVVLDPLIASGVDVAWTDFQQGFPGLAGVRGVGCVGSSRGSPGAAVWGGDAAIVSLLRPTAILNHFRFYGFGPAGARGTLHSRYAGRGDHRHASHFGGDVAQTWESLRFLVYFTATAANAPACWWGHEMMRAGGGADDASELFTRVNQFGAWSPVFTSWGNDGSNNDWWTAPEPHRSAIRGALLDRAVLLPYRYTAAADAHASGRCPVVPMYRAHPFEADAYAAPAQYWLGADVVVAPVAAPAQPGAAGVVDVAVWLPPGGPWYAFRDPGGTPPLPGGWASVAAGLGDTPAFVRAGAVLPQLPAAAAAAPGAAARPYSALVFAVYPGAASGRGRAYEDDGVSPEYLLGAAAETALAYSPAGAVGCTAYNVTTTGARYAGMVTTRAYAVFLQAAPRPASVALDGAPLPEAARDGAPGTWFRAAAGDTRAYLRPVSVDDAPSLVVCL